MIEFLLLFMLLAALEWAGSVREEHELEQELQRELQSICTLDEPCDWCTRL